MNAINNFGKKNELIILFDGLTSGKEDFWKKELCFEGKFIFINEFYSIAKTYLYRKGTAAPKNRKENITTPKLQKIYEELENNDEEKPNLLVYVPSDALEEFSKDYNGISDIVNFALWLNYKKESIHLLWVVQAIELAFQQSLSVAQHTIGANDITFQIITNKKYESLLYAKALNYTFNKQYGIKNFQIIFANEEKSPKIFLSDNSEKLSSICLDFIFADKEDKKALNDEFKENVEKIEEIGELKNFSIIPLRKCNTKKEIAEKVMQIIKQNATFYDEAMRQYVTNLKVIEKSKNLET